MDRCVCCGAIVPEGTQVCWNCLNYMSFTEYVFEEKEIKYV